VLAQIKREGARSAGVLVATHYKTKKDRVIVSEKRKEKIKKKKRERVGKKKFT